jgi:multiple sugar transport system substrate-binding protein
MKSNKSKLVALLLAMMMIFTLAGCGGEETASSTEPATDVEESTTVEATQETEEVVVDEGPVMDLGGMEIIIGDWWSPEEPAEPTTTREEDTLAYRNMIQEKYNFKIKQVAVTDWGGMQELFTTSVMAEDPAAHVFVLGPDWTAQPLANGLLYDVSTLESFDFSDSKWNKSVLEAMKFGDAIYGMAAGMAEPKLGVYFNKRLFEEAGLNPELPYELQASGQWTWAKFEEICQQLTRDYDNDGIVDSHAMASFSIDLIRGATTSNNAKFIDKGSDGKFVNATSDPNFLEALQWVQSLIEKGYEMPVPQDANWDWFVSAFQDAKVAMTFGEQYKVGTWANMTDDWGFVLCPIGPKMDNYAAYFSDNVAVIPSSYDQETAEKIAFAYNLWTAPTPGYEYDDEGWKDSYYTRFRDARAVDETLNMMYTSAEPMVEYMHYVYGTSFGDFAWNIYGLVQTPAEKIEEVNGMWKTLIDDANK